MASENLDERKECVKETLEQYIKEYRIFIDTCSILHESADEFWGVVCPLLQKYNKKIIVPLRSWEELAKHANSKAGSALSYRAESCIQKIQSLRKEGYIEIRGEETDNFADNVFQVVFTKFRMTHNLLLITQDNNLAKDILALNESKAVKANPISVKRINKNGYLSDFYWNSENNNSDSKKKASKKMYSNSDDLDSDEIFTICTKITSLPDAKIRVSRIPCEGDTVYTSQGAIVLAEKIGAGGEAVVYETYTPYAAKIYKKEKITVRKLNKIKLMLSKEVDCPGICYPIEIIYNSAQEFVGYLMPKAKGTELQKSVFAPKPLFIKKFPDWKKRDTVELCITILKKIKYLHARNIIIGDINPANILVVSSKEVYFVDADSFQIEDYPCPVGTINFTAPEIQGKCFGDFLRTMGNENFAVATLLFMIMLPGKPPYSQQGGEDPISNIVKMNFSYPFGENSNKRTPEGPWRYIWSHLTYDMKEAFYNTFRKGGKYSLEEDRMSVNEWLPIFQYFLELLDSGKYGQQDKMSEELFPTRLKRNPKAIYIQCKICKQEVEENQCKNGMCRKCLNEGEVYRCKRCGRELIYTNYQRYVKNSKRYDVCKECYDYGHEVKIRQRCIECGKEFELTNGQYEYYQDKRLSIPKRCKACRNLKKNMANSICPYNNFDNHFERYGFSSYTGQPEDRGHYGSDSSRGEDIQTAKTDNSTEPSCYITTAVCEYYGKDDNCEELTVLRQYRDSWLRKQADGEALIAEYYCSAPFMVNIMKQSTFYADYCEYLMQNYINPCIRLIQEGCYMECKNLYIEMVLCVKSLIQKIEEDECYV